MVDDSIDIIESELELYSEIMTQVKALLPDIAPFDMILVATNTIYSSVTNQIQSRAYREIIDENKEQMDRMKKDSNETGVYQ